MTCIRASRARAGRSSATWYVEPEPAGQARGPGHVRGARHDRARPVGPDDRPGRSSSSSCRPRAGRGAGAPPRSTAATAWPVRTSRRPRGRGRAGPGRAATGRTRRAGRRLVAVGEAERGAAARSRRASPGSAGSRPRCRGRHAEPAQRRDRRGRGEHAAGPPAPGRVPLEHDDLATGRGQPDGDDGARRPAADDGDLDALAASSAARRRADVVGGPRRASRRSRSAGRRRRVPRLDRDEPGPAQQRPHLGGR